MQLGKNKKDVASAVECYMTEKGLTGEEAVAAIASIARTCEGSEPGLHGCSPCTPAGGAADRKHREDVRGDVPPWK